MIYTIEDVIADAKLSEFFPTSQATFADPGDLITLANRAMTGQITPLVKSVQQHFYATHKNVTPVVNMSRYALPERALGDAIENVWWCPNTAFPNVRYQIVKTERSRISSWQATSGTPAQGYIEGDEIVLVPTPANLQGTEAIVFDYLERPSKLVATTSCAKITGISTAAGVTTFTVDTDLTGSLAVNALIDVAKGASPFRLSSRDAAITAITTSTIAVSATSVQDESGATSPVIGDYICAAQTTNIPMMPADFRPLLAELICFQALKALGATAKLQTCAAFVKDLMAGAHIMINNRVEEQVDVIYDRYGLLDSASSFGYTNVVR